MSLIGGGNGTKELAVTVAQGMATGLAMTSIHPAESKVVGHALTMVKKLQVS